MAEGGVGPARSMQGVAGGVPASVRISRVLLYVASGLTIAYSIQIWLVVGGARGFGAGAFFLVPAAACAVAARRLLSGGWWVWWGVLVLEMFYLVWQLGRLPAGDQFGLVGLSFPIVILVSVCRSRGWFEPAGWREVRALAGRGTAAVRWRPRSDRGDGAVGYLTAVVVTAAIAAALVGAGVPGRVTSAVRSAVCDVTSGSCEDSAPEGRVGRPVALVASPRAGAPVPAVSSGLTAPAPASSPPSSPPSSVAPSAPAPGAPVPNPSALGAGSAAPVAPAPNSFVEQQAAKQPKIGLPRGNFIPGEDYDERLDCDEWAQNACDFGQGIWIGGVDAVYGIGDGADLLACTAYIRCGEARFNETHEGWQSLVTTNPIDTAKAIWDASTKDIGNDVDQGIDGRAAGRVVPTALGAVFGGKGINQLKNVEKAAKAAESAGDVAPIVARLDNVPPPKTVGDFATTKMDSHYVGENNRSTGAGVQYLDATEREAYRIVVHDGRFYRSNGEPFDTSEGSSAWTGEGNAIFVMDEHGNLYASPYHEPGKFHHSSFLGGAPVAGAGELQVVDGKLVGISDRSGHYAPRAPYLQQVVDSLRDAGVEVSDDMIQRWGR